MRFSDHFPRTQSFYNQNPQKVHFAAGAGVVATFTTSVLARVAKAPLPKTAKLTIFGLTFVSNLGSLNMKDASLGELTKVIMIGKNIVDNITSDIKHVASQFYNFIAKELQIGENEVKVAPIQTTSVDPKIISLEKDTSSLKVDLLEPLLLKTSINPDKISATETPLSGSDSDTPQESAVTSD